MLTLTVIILGIVWFIWKKKSAQPKSQQKQEQQQQPVTPPVQPNPVQPKPASKAPEPVYVEPVRRERFVPDSIPVKTRRRFFTRAEEAFYWELLKATKEKPVRVYCKPRLDDIFEADGHITQGERNRLTNKHVDFLITDLQFKPLMGIELDGDSHLNERQIHNDKVKDMVFRSAKLPLVRFTNKQNAKAADITKQIARCWE